MKSEKKIIQYFIQKISPSKYNVILYGFFMENYSEDIGEEIISRLKELIRILELKFNRKYGKECSPPHCN
jgi:hypothetical protein